MCLYLNLQQDETHHSCGINETTLYTNAKPVVLKPAT